MVIELRIDNTRIGVAFADDVPESQQHASALAIAECQIGQAVWARMDGGEGHMDGGYKSTFSGYLFIAIPSSYILPDITTMVRAVETAQWTCLVYKLYFIQ